MPIVPVADLTIEQLRELVAIHKTKRLRLAFSVGLSGEVSWGDEEPQALVTELLRLATLALVAIDAANGGRPVEDALSAADAAWRAGIAP